MSYTDADFDDPPFAVVREALDPAAIDVISALLRSLRYTVPTGAQSGFSLAAHAYLHQYLKPLEAMASAELERPTYIDFSRSSCRIQKPDGHGRLTLHQDTAACGITKPDQRAVIFWVPVHDITPHHPTIEFCLAPTAELLKHIADPAGYSVLADQDRTKLGLFDVMDDLRRGDVVVATPYAVHGTYIPENATEERTSLDIRCLPLA